MKDRTVSFHRTAERPSLQLWLFDDTQTLVDFSSGYTFVFKVGRPGSNAVLTKTAGISGAAGSGVEPTGTPNVTVVWTAGELDVAVGPYTWQLVATSGGLDRIFTGPLRILDVIT